MVRVRQIKSKIRFGHNLWGAKTGLLLQRPQVGKNIYSPKYCKVVLFSDICQRRHWNTSSVHVMASFQVSRGESTGWVILISLRMLLHPTSHQNNFLQLQTTPNGSLWLPMIYLWLPMASLWLPMTPSNSHQIPLGPYDFPVTRKGSHVTLYNSLQIPTAPFDFPLTPNDSHRVPTTPNHSQPFPTTAYDSQRLQTTPNDSLRVPTTPNIVNATRVTLKMQLFCFR